MLSAEPIASMRTGASQSVACSATDTTTIIQVGGPIYAIAAGAGGGPQVNVYFANTGTLSTLR